MVERVIEKVGFVHLHVHTAFSLREGAIGVGKLLKLALADSQPAVAVTDGNNLFGALEISEKFAKEGVQPIVGCQLTVDFGDARNFQRPRRVARRRRGPGQYRAAGAKRAGLRQSHAAGLAAWLEVEQGDTPHVGLAQLARGRAKG